MSEDWRIKPSEWINARSIGKAETKPVEPPKIDPEVSQIVGKPIAVNDPRLVRLVNKWRLARPNNDDFDEFIKDAAKVDELRKTFNPEKFGEISK